MFTLQCNNCNSSCVTFLVLSRSSHFSPHETMPLLSRLRISSEDMSKVLATFATAGLFETMLLHKLLPLGLRSLRLWNRT